MRNRWQWRRKWISSCRILPAIPQGHCRVQTCVPCSPACARWYAHPIPLRLRCSHGTIPLWYRRAGSLPSSAASGRPTGRWPRMPWRMPPSWADFPNGPVLPRTFASMVMWRPRPIRVISPYLAATPLPSAPSLSKSRLLESGYMAAASIPGLKWSGPCATRWP